MVSNASMSQLALLQGEFPDILAHASPPCALDGVMAGHCRSKNSVAALAYVPAIHVFGAGRFLRRGCPRQARA
jgi:hypothetical protein